MYHSSRAITGKVFVARPFDSMGNRIFANVVAPALATFDLTPVHCHLCEIRHVVEHVQTTIGRCDAVIAVLTGRTQNVLIETGITIALRKPLIILASEHADAGMLLGTFPVILLGDAAGLRFELKNLSQRIDA